MCGGWIKSHRKILEWQWVHDPPTRDLWWYLLHKAAYEETEVDGVVLHPGECLDGQRSIAKFLGFSYQQIRTAQKNLEKTREIETYSGDALTQKLTHDPTQDLTHAKPDKRTLYKVVKWDEYQPPNARSNAQSNASTNARPENPSLYINKEDIRSNKEDISTPSSEPAEQPEEKPKKQVKKQAKKKAAPAAGFPDVQTVAAYLEENGWLDVDPEYIIEYYSNRQVKNWKLCCNTFHKNNVSWNKTGTAPYFRRKNQPEGESYQDKIIARQKAEDEELMKEYGLI